MWEDVRAGTWRSSSRDERRTLTDLLIDSQDEGRDLRILSTQDLPLKGQALCPW
jgi:hypothetical protein